MNRASDNQPLKEIWNGEKWREVRRAFLKGERHSACQRCWDNEDRGLFSHRNAKVPRDAMKKVQADGSIDAYPDEFYLRLGNVCNLKCVMCTPHNSTKWKADQDIYLKYVDNQVDDDQPEEWTTDTWTNEALAGAKIISFAGGEPLIIPQHDAVLDLLFSRGTARDTELKYYTNLTHMPDSLFEKWRAFRLVDLKCSIDGFGPSYNYIRYPGEWSTVEKNLLRVNEANLPNLNLEIAYVFFALSALDFVKLFEWREGIDWKRPAPVIKAQSLYQPSFMPASVLKPEDKEEVLAAAERIFKLARYDVETSLLKRVLTEMTDHQGQAADRLKLKNYLGELDPRRGLNYRKTFSHLQSFHDGEGNDGFADRLSP